MRIKAKFSSKCPECGQQIEKGDDIFWAPGAKAEHWDCHHEDIPPKEPEEDQDQELDLDAVLEEYPFSLGQRVDYQGVQYHIAKLHRSTMGGAIANLTKREDWEKGARFGEPVVQLDDLLKYNQPDSQQEAGGEPPQSAEEPNDPRPAAAEATAAQTEQAMTEEPPNDPNDQPEAPTNEASLDRWL